MLAPVNDGADKNLAPFTMHLIRTLAGYLGWQADFAMSSDRPIEYARSGWDRVPGLSCLDAIIHRGRGTRDAMGYGGGDV